MERVKFTVFESELIAALRKALPYVEKVARRKTSSVRQREAVEDVASIRSTIYKAQNR